MKSPCNTLNFLAQSSFNLTLITWEALCNEHPPIALIFGPAPDWVLGYSNPSTLELSFGQKYIKHAEINIKYTCREILYHLQAQSLPLHVLQDGQTDEEAQVKAHSTQHLSSCIFLWSLSILCPGQKQISQDMTQSQESACWQIPVLSENTIAKCLFGILGSGAKALY